MNLKNSILVFFGILISFHISAQEQLGLRIENYSGINGVLLNPTHNLTSPFAWDVNLIAVGQFVDNNFGYVNTTRLIELAKNAENIEPAGDLNEDQQPSQDALVFDFYDNNKKKFLTATTNIMGPSFMVNLNSGHTFGLFTNGRVAVSAQSIPGNLNYYEFNRTSFFEYIEADPFTIASMVWSELGLNYAYRGTTVDGSFGIGANVKFLNGYEAFVVKNNQTTSFAQFPGDSLHFTGANFDYAFTNSNTSGEDFNRQKNGAGVAFDLGAMFTIDSGDNTYLWKFGAALLDIGRIKFTKNAQRHRIITDSLFTLSSTAFENADDVMELTNTLSIQSLGDSLASSSANQFSVWLPTALSLQADYTINPLFRVNATLIQRIPIGEFAIKRGNLLAITPRFEHRWLGAALPISLYNWQQLNLGLSLRLAFLTIGTENLGSIINRSDFTGTDFYVALKINPFKLNIGGGIGGGGGKKGIKCYDF